MSRTFPSKGIAKKHNTEVSADNAVIQKIHTALEGEYGIMYRLWVSIDVASETDLENLSGMEELRVTIGSGANVKTWYAQVHPLIAHTDTTKFRYVDLGPWFFDFGDEGFYNGIEDSSVTILIPAFGTGIKSRISYLYSGD